MFIISPESLITLVCWGAHNSRQSLYKAKDNCKAFTTATYTNM